MPFFDDFSLFPPRDTEDWDAPVASPFARTIEGAILGLIHRTPIGARLSRDGRAPSDALRPVLATLRASVSESERTEDVVRQAVRKALRRAAPHPPLPEPEEPVRSNIATIAGEVGLDELDRDLLLFLTAMHVSPALVAVTTLLGPFTLAGAAEVCAAALGRSRPELTTRLATTGRLVQIGFLSVTDRGRQLTDKIEIDPRVLDLVHLDPVKPGALLARLLPESRPAELDLADYAHLGGDVDLVVQLLRAALKRRAAGVNVLLYGETGTGKTELARVIACALGVRLHLAGMHDGEGRDPSLRERIASLRLGNRILDRAPAILLFDEMEDLDGPDMNVYGFMGVVPRLSKAFLNDLLETNRVPTLWCTNRVSQVDPAFLRRFSFALEFRAFGPLQRRRAWKRHLGEGLDHGTVGRLGSRVECSPGEIAAAVRAGRLLAQGDDLDLGAMEAIASSVSRLVRGPARRDQPAHGDVYDLRFVNATADLEAIADSLVRWKRGFGPGPSLCLHGPPGTGKTAYVHHLGRLAGRTIVARKASDLLSAYVGESEKNIADAFRDAEAQDAILLLDECDSFLRDRRGATHSWEVTQVNEFLQQLEGHSGITCCSTNLFDDLDQASLRRFAFKVEFRWLRPEQAVGLFKALLVPLLGRPIAREEGERVGTELGRIGRLTPGDFAAVNRRMRILGGFPSAADLLVELRREVAVKEGPAHVIGF